MDVGVYIFAGISRSSGDGLGYHVDYLTQVVLVVKYLPANAGDLRNTSSIPEPGRSPGGGQGNSLQYSCSVLAWKIPQTMEPGGLQFMQLQRVNHD